MTLQKTKVRPMRVSEVESLETLLSYSNMEAEFNHWIDHGEPQHHIWLKIRELLDFLKAVKPETPLDYPSKKMYNKPVPALPYDNEELT